MTRRESKRDRVPKINPSFYRFIQGTTGYYAFLFILILAILPASLWFNSWGVPSAPLLTGIIIGLLVNLVGNCNYSLNEKTTTTSSALVGVLLGTYLDSENIKKLGFGSLEVILLSCSTILIGTILARILVYRGYFDAKTAILGLMPGGSAGVVAASREVGANTEYVGFMQYSRAIIVAVSAPFIFSYLEPAAVKGKAAATHSTSIFNYHYFQLVQRSDQLAGISIIIVISIVGIWLAKMLRIPSASLLGPLIVSTIVALFGFSHGYTPIGMFRDTIFALVGLEVGLKFTRETFVQALKRLPVIIVTIIILCSITGLLAYLLAKHLGMPVADVYLATTPGGINSVISTAQNGQSNATLITSTQSIRLLVSLLSLPILIKWTIPRAMARSELSKPELTPSE